MALELVELPTDHAAIAGAAYDSASDRYSPRAIRRRWSLWTPWRSESPILLLRLIVDTAQLWTPRVGIALLTNWPILSNARDSAMSAPML